MSTVKDIYRILFGREGTSKGSDIDMAEHGRAGGVSVGTPFKGMQEIPLKFIMDIAGGGIIYMGEANHGVETSAESWRIAKMVIDGSVITIFYADGNDLFDNKWTERAELDYN